MPTDNLYDHTTSTLYNFPYTTMSGSNIGYSYPITNTNTYPWANNQTPTYTGTYCDTCVWCGYSYAHGSYHTCTPQQAPGRFNLDIHDSRIMDLELKVGRLTIQLQEALDFVQQLTRKEQDAQVCRHSDEGCESPDQERGRSGAPKPRGNWSWPPRTENLT